MNYANRSNDTNVNSWNYIAIPLPTAGYLQR